VVSALHVPEASARAPMTILTENLRDRQLLLVLDNCEHLLEGCAMLVDALLRVAPQLRVLTTSRQALRVPGESLFAVPPLPVPEPEAVLSAGDAVQYPALALFAERASAVVREFAITTDNLAAVARVCQRLEGIPLAIELAAARLPVLSVADLAARLDDRFELLTEGSRTVHARHRTLQATIDWSHDLCTPAEQTLWARTSVFAGSFDLEGAQAVCSDAGLPPEAILDTVAGMADKSIVVREELAGQVRFRLLETIGEYGQAKLHASGGEHVLLRRHRDWYTHLIDAVAAEWFGPKQEEWLVRLQLEYPNLRKALEFCVAEPGQTRAGLHLAGTPWFLWVACGFLAEGRHWLDRLLALDMEPSLERARALGTGGYVAAVQGDQSAAAAMLEECRLLARRLDDPGALAYATHVLGLSAMLSGDLDRASALLEEALPTYAAVGAPDHLAGSLRIALGLSYLFQQDLERAVAHFADCRTRCEQRGERWLLSYAFWGLGFVELIRGELEPAAAHVRESLRIKRFFHDTLGLSMALDLLAWIMAAQGDGERAAILLGAASRLWQTFGLQRFGSKDLIARHEQFTEQAHRALGDRAFETALARGSELALDKALAFALDERPTAAATPSRSGGIALTRREKEIVDLVARGMSNKEIAAALVISLRTAEGHVEHILAKLGFTSRAQIAAWGAEQRVHAQGSADGRNKTFR
jgi:non-specific serine/threonine protein kinase